MYVRALKEYPLDEKSGEDVARLAAVVDGGWDHLANAYADIVSMHDEPEVQRTIGKRLARVFEDELGDITKAEETYKYVLGVEPLDVDALVEPRSHLLCRSSRGPSSRTSSNNASRPAPKRSISSSSTRASARFTRRSSPTTRTPFACSVASSTISTRRTKPPSPRSDASTPRTVAGPSFSSSTNASSRTRRETPPKRTFARRLAISSSIDSVSPSARSKRGRRVLDLRGEDAEALGALANLYEQQQLWRELIDVLERQNEAETEDDKRVNILSRKARMFTEKLQQDGLALEDWNRVLDFDFANLGALRAIAAIRRRAGDPTELVNALHQMVDRAAALLDGEELKEIFRELGKTYGEQLGQPFDAADAWRKLLEVGPDFEAMDALEAIYRGEEKWTDVVDVKMQRAAALEDQAQKIEEYRQVAALWRERIEDPDKATLAWQKIIEIDGTHDEAFAELEKLHTAAGRWEPLVELYLARLETREETADKTDMLRRIARVFEEHLDDQQPSARRAHQRARRGLPRSRDGSLSRADGASHGPLERGHHDGEQWLKEQTDPQQKIRLCLHLAKWYGDDLGKPEYAQPYYAQIVQLDPNNVGALRQMGQLYRKSGNHQLRRLADEGARSRRERHRSQRDPERARRAPRLADEPDGSSRQLFPARARSRSAVPTGAREPRTHLHGARAEPRARRHPHAQSSGADGSGGNRGDQAPHRLALRGTLGDPQKAAQVFRESSRSTRRTSRRCAVSRARAKCSNSGATS